MLFLIPLSPYSQCSYGSAFCYYRLISIFQKSSCFLGIIQHVLCFLFVCVLVWLVSLRIIILRFIHVVASIRGLILFIAESYFIVLQFIHSTIQLFFKINFYWSIVDLQHCQFLLYRKVRQLYIYTYPLFFRFCSHIGHYRTLNTELLMNETFVLSPDFDCYK